MPSRSSLAMPLLLLGALTAATAGFIGLARGWQYATERVPADFALTADAGTFSGFVTSTPAAATFEGDATPISFAVFGARELPLQALICKDSERVATDAGPMRSIAITALQPNAVRWTTPARTLLLNETGVTFAYEGSGYPTLGLLRVALADGSHAAATTPAGTTADLTPPSRSCVLTELQGGSDVFAGDSAHLRLVEGGGGAQARPWNVRSLATASVLSMTMERGTLGVGERGTLVQASASIEIHGTLHVDVVDGRLAATGRATFLELNHAQELPVRWPWLDGWLGDWLRLALPAAAGAVIGVATTLAVSRDRRSRA